MYLVSNNHEVVCPQILNTDRNLADGLSSIRVEKNLGNGFPWSVDLFHSLKNLFYWLSNYTYLLSNIHVCTVKFWSSNKRQRMPAEFQTCIIPVSLLASIMEIMQVDGRMAAMTSSTITWPVFGEAGTKVTPIIHSNKKIKN